MRWNDDMRPTCSKCGADVDLGEYLCNQCEHERRESRRTKTVRWEREGPVEPVDRPPRPTTGPFGRPR